MADLSSAVWSTEGSKQNPNRLKEKENSEPGIGHPAKLFFKEEDKIRTYLGKVKLKEFTTNRISLVEFLKAVIMEVGGSIQQEGLRHKKEWRNGKW